MRRAIASTFAGVLCAALLATGLPGRAWAEEDVCARSEETLPDLLRNVSLELNREALEDEAASRPTADGINDGSRLDLLRRAFAALSLGDVQDEEGKLVFNFNPDALHLDSFGQFSPRIVVHQPVLYGALDKGIDMLAEDLRIPARDELKEDLGDLDDVEYTVRWTPKRFEPATDLQLVASELMNQVTPNEPSALTERITQAKVAIARVLGRTTDNNPFARFPMSEICGVPGDPGNPGNPAAEALLNALVQQLRTDIPLANAALQEALDGNGFTRLADLIEGNPRLVFDGNFRQRSGGTGPDETSLDVTWQWGWVSYKGAKRWIAKQPGNLELNGASLNKYFEEHGRLEGAAPLFSLVASYSETDDFLIDIPNADPFRQDGVRKLSGKATAARYFGGGRDRKLELTAAYDDVSNDEALQDRFVADLTWVEKLSETLAQVVGGSEFVASVVWASKPEFRGEVDEEFGLRAGLKWSFGDGDDTK